MSIWSSMGILVLSLIAIYFLLRLVILKKLKVKYNPDKLLNILLITSLIGFFAIILSKISLPILVYLLLNSLDTVSALVLATTGIVLIFRTSITTNFAQGMMATFGAFVTAWSVKIFSKDIAYLASRPVLTLSIALVLGVLTSFILGLIIDIFIIRKARFVTPVGKQMITMGLVLVISGILPMIFGVIPVAIPTFTNEIMRFKFMNFNLTFPKHSLISGIITVVVLIILFTALKFTKWGLGVRATASSELVASMMGVNTKVITALSWAVAGALGGLAAIMFAPTNGNVSVALMTQMQVNGFLASILGGFSTFGGPIVGAILIPVLRSTLAFFESEWVNVIVYAIILLLVLIKPVGLFGKKISKKV
jgi:branched-chain amino acid transport system permease protein